MNNVQQKGTSHLTMFASDEFRKHRIFWYTRDHEEISQQIKCYCYNKRKTGRCTKPGTTFICIPEHIRGMKQCFKQKFYTLLRSIFTKYLLLFYASGCSDKTLYLSFLERRNNSEFKTEVPYYISCNKLIFV